MAPLVQERVATLGEVPGHGRLRVPRPAGHRRGRLGQGRGRRSTRAVADPGRRPSRPTRRLVEDGPADALHAATQSVAEGVGRKLGKAQAPIRVAVTGRRVGPPLFEALEVMGPDGPWLVCARRWPGPGSGPMAGPRCPARPVGVLSPVARTPPASPAAHRSRPVPLSLRAGRRAAGGGAGLPGGHRGAGLADRPPLRAAPGRRHRGHGRRPVQRGALPGPGVPAPPGRAPVAPALRLGHHGDRLQGAG